MRPIIVKVQRSITPNSDTVLIYDEKRTFIHQYPLTNYIEERLNGKLKGYFHSYREKDGKLILGAGAPPQNW
jgi:hypothetical protein